MFRIMMLMMGLILFVIADSSTVQPASFYSRSTSGVVIDHTTKLEWQDSYDDNDGKIKQLNWSEAKQYCQAMLLEGHTDWRLPAIDELMSITDKTRLELSIDSIFQMISSSGYWSATTIANKKGSAWYLSFHGGNANWGGKGGTLNIRCVRDNKVVLFTHLQFRALLH